MAAKMQDYAKYEHIEKLQNNVLPRMSDFAKRVDKFSTEHLDMKCCIADFDMALCEKANK